MANETKQEVTIPMNDNPCNVPMCIFVRDTGSKYCNHHCSSMEAYDRKHEPTKHRAIGVPVACAYCGEGSQDHETCRKAVEWERKRNAKNYQPAPTQPITEPSAREWINEHVDSKFPVVLEMFQIDGEWATLEAVLEAWGKFYANYKLRSIAAEVGEIAEKLVLCFVTADDPDFAKLRDEVQDILKAWLQVRLRVAAIIQSTIERKAQQ